MLPTIEEFRADSKLAQRQVNRSILPAFLAGGGMLLSLVLGMIVQHWWGENAAHWLMGPMFCFTLASGVLLIVGLFRVERVRKRFGTLICARCARSLAKDSDTETVIASRHCPSCGCRVLRAADAST